MYHVVAELYGSLSERDQELVQGSLFADDVDSARPVAVPSWAPGQVH